MPSISVIFHYSTFTSKRAVLESSDSEARSDNVIVEFDLPRIPVGISRRHSSSFSHSGTVATL